MSTILLPMHACRFLWSTNNCKTIASKDWRRVKEAEDGDGSLEDPKGDKIQTEKEVILAKRMFKQEARAAAGSCELPPEHATYNRSG